MNDVERQALQELHLRFMDDLDPWEIMIDYLHEKKCFTSYHLDTFQSITDKRKCRRYFLELVKQKCTHEIFISGLSYRQTHKHLAEMYQTKVEELKSCNVSINSGKSCDMISKAHKRDLDGRLEFQNSKKRREFPVSNKSDDPFGIKLGIHDSEIEESFTNPNCCPLCKKPNRINIMDSKKQRVVRIQHHLKVLSHDGQTSKFESFIKKMFKRNKKDPDIKFALLDARVGRKKVSDNILPNEDVFNKMEKEIPYTTNPLAASMLYLSRKGSAIAEVGPIQSGLEELQYAKSHSEFIQPCKDTGMVLYIEVNLLMKLFEKKPSQDLKDKIIKRISEAINVHFANEQPEVREDYTRMLYLKMVFCYLGIGVDASPIKDYKPCEEDIRNGESCLALIDRLPAMLDRRRRMFYHVSRSVLFRYTGVLDLAWDHVRSAAEKGEEGQFQKELRSISSLASDIRSEIAAGEADIDKRGEQLLRELGGTQETEALSESSDEDI